ncbi:MAG: hypothetical protein GX117_06265 [Candidatus Hydrogenedentes bacterium]|jgi:hypothetical protein|nr:hypothetical protein [Candidatus Hydrogenedentota bacterium]
MTTLSWLFMGSIWIIIFALNIFCFRRMFWKKQPSEGTDSNEEMIR